MSVSASNGESITLPRGGSSLRVLSKLLSYPDAEWQEALPSMLTTLQEESLLEDDDALAINAAFRPFREADLYELQEGYVDLFDRTRALSLHLFEHVHGESRDRGQAMVDLIDFYREHGYEIAAHELPDYLPMFLEFLSLIPQEEAKEMLGQPVHILSAIGAKLKKRRSPYASVFDALQRLAGKTPAEATEEESATESLDESWTEEKVEFLAAETPMPKKSGGCGGGNGGCGCAGNAKKQ